MPLPSVSRAPIYPSVSRAPARLSVSLVSIFHPPPTWIQSPLPAMPNSRPKLLIAFGLLSPTGHNLSSSQAQFRPHSHKPSLTPNIWPSSLL